MSKRGENIRKRNDGRWESRLVDKKTGKYKCFYGKTYIEAKQKRNDYFAASKEIEEIIIKADLETDVSLSDIFSIWLSEHGNTVKLSTYSTYSGIINKHLVPLIGSMSINELSIKKINEVLYQWLQSDGAFLSDKYTHDIISVLKAVLIYTSEKYNMALSIKDILSVSVSKCEIVTLDDFEQKILLKYLNDKKDLSKLGIVLCLYTGMRIGEICALKWSDIYINQGYIDINKTLFRTKNVFKKSVDGVVPKTIIKIGKPKTKASVRKIPICSFLADVIKATGSHNSEDYFLTDSSSYMEPRTYQNHFKRYLRDAGIKDVNFHVLRHTFATNCINVGCDVKSLSDILGHASVKITLDRYVHPSIQTKRSQLDKLTVYKF